MILLLSKSKISSRQPSSVAVQPGLCRTRSETKMLISHDAAQLFKRRSHSDGSGLRVYDGLDIFSFK